MGAENRKPESEDLDRWLDLALRERANAEPRSGLEERVLARLAAHPQHRIVWWPAMAVAALLLAIVIAVAVFSPRHKQQMIANRPQPPVASHDTGVGVNTRAPDKELRSAKSRVPKASDTTCCASAKMLESNNPRGAVPRPRVRVETELLPKLATFPAPRPETAQERMLARLMAQRGSYELASASPDMVPLKDLSIPELKIEPMEGTPSDETPHE